MLRMPLPMEREWEYLLCCYQGDREEEELNDEAMEDAKIVAEVSHFQMVEWEGEEIDAHLAEVVLLLHLG